MNKNNNKLTVVSCLSIAIFSFFFIVLDANENIVKPTMNDEGELWNQYLTFYKAIDHSEDLTLLLWQRILDETHPIHCLVVEDKSSKKLLGFVHFSPQVTTWQKEYECYLEDLFVTDELRGKSIGEQLINEVVVGFT